MKPRGCPLRSPVRAEVRHVRAAFSVDGAGVRGEMEVLYCSKLTGVGWGVSSRNMAELLVWCRWPGDKITECACVAFRCNKGPNVRIRQADGRWWEFNRIDSVESVYKIMRDYLGSEVSCPW